MSTLSVGTIKSGSTSAPPIIQTSTGTQIGTFCRAWVNFDGTGTVAIRAQFNVSSITDGGVGRYTVNLTTAMPDVNYCVVTGGWDGSAPMSVYSRPSTDSTITMEYYTGDGGGGGGSHYDESLARLAVFR